MSMLKVVMKTGVQKYESGSMSVFINDVVVVISEIFMSQLTCEPSIEANKEYSVLNVHCTDSTGEDPFKDMAAVIYSVQELPVEFGESNAVVGDVSMVRASSEGCSIVPTTVAPTTVAPTEAPTTVAPTTEAPTTVAPTTVAPTTVAPTVAPTTVAPTVAPTTVAPTPEPKNNILTWIIVGVVAVVIIVVVACCFCYRPKGNELQKTLV